ncbi:hypothetical protein Bca101_019989 [Brassica carinata]
MDLRSNPFEEGGNDTPRIEHRPARIMDTAQGGDLVNQLDPTEIFPSDRAEQTVRTVPFHHPNRTARAVHRIDPWTSGMEHSLEPRHRDGIDRPMSLLSQPIQHFKTDSQARIHLEREEYKDGHIFSFMALFVHTACPDGCTDVLASMFDPLMVFIVHISLRHGYLTV